MPLPTCWTLSPAPSQKFLFAYFKLIVLHLFAVFYVWDFVHAKVCVSVWRSEANFRVLVPSFHDEVPGDQTQAFQPGEGTHRVILPALCQKLLQKKERLE